MYFVSTDLLSLYLTARGFIGFRTVFSSPLPPMVNYVFYWLLMLCLEFLKKRLYAQFIVCGIVTA